MSEPVRSVLRRLTRVAGVRGAMVVDADAGIPVASELSPGIEETALSALTGSLFRRSAEATATSGFGAARTLQLESEHGHVVVSGAGSLLVVALADPTAQLGMVRIEADRAAGGLGQ